MRATARSRGSVLWFPLWYHRRVRLFVAVALLAGCDSLWGITRLVPASDAAPEPIDGAPIDAACAPQIIHDDFTSTKLCSNWGTPSGLSATEGGGMLVIAPEPNVGGSQGGCFAAAPLVFGDQGVFIKVTSVLEQYGDGMGGSYMFFTVRSPDPSDAVTLTLSVAGDTIEAGSAMQTVGTAAYDPVQPKWWRIRPDRDLPGIVGEMSPDGFTWQRIGSASGTLPTSVIVEFTAGTYGAGLPDPGMAIIEDFNVCPGA
jgi:hypothetical protein